MRFVPPPRRRGPRELLREACRLGSHLPVFRIVEQEDGETAAQLATRVAQVRARLGPAAIVMAIEGQPFEVYDGRDGGRRGEEPPPGWAGLSVLPGASLAAAQAAQRAGEGQDDGPLKPVCLGPEVAATPDPEPGRLSLVPAPFPDPSTWRVRVDAETGRKLLIMHPDAPVSTPEDVAQATADAAYRAALGVVAKKGSN